MKFIAKYYLSNSHGKASVQVFSAFKAKRPMFTEYGGRYWEQNARYFNGQIVTVYLDIVRGEAYYFEFNRQWYRVPFHVKSTRSHFLTPDEDALGEAISYILQTGHQTEIWINDGDKLRVSIQTTHAFFVECPYCDHQIDLADETELVTCESCGESYEAEYNLGSLSDQH